MLYPGVLIGGLPSATGVGSGDYSVTIQGGVAKQVMELVGGVFASGTTGGKMFRVNEPSDSVAGNTRGAYSVDLQEIRSAATMVASGGGATIVGGQDNTGSGGFTVTGGQSNRNPSSNSSIFGVSNDSDAGNAGVDSLSNIHIRGFGCQAYAGNTHISGSNAQGRTNGARSHGWIACPSNAIQSVMQDSIIHMVRQTTNATPATMTISGSGATAKITLPRNSVFGCEIAITSSRNDLSKCCLFRRNVVIKNIAGVTSLTSDGVITVGTDIVDGTACAVTITADDTNDCLQIQVTGIAAQTWEWFAVVRTYEIPVLVI